MRDSSAVPGSSSINLGDFPVFTWETDLKGQFLAWNDSYFSREKTWISPRVGQPLSEWVGPSVWRHSLSASWSSAAKRGPVPLRFDVHEQRFQGWARPKRNRLRRVQRVQGVAVACVWLPALGSDSDVDATSFEPSLSPVVWHRIAKLTADYVLLLDRQARILSLHHHRSGDLSARFANKTVYDVTSVESHEKLREAINRAFETGVTEIVPILIETGDGRSRLLEGRISSLAEFDETSCVILTAVDTSRWRSLHPSLTREERALRQLLEIQDRERRLVAYEIHDGLIQDVIAAQMIISSLQAQPDLAEKLKVDLASANERLKEVLREGRRLISELRPMVIDETGLVESIEYLRHEFTTRFPDMAIDTDLEMQFERLEPLLEGTLFRVIKEALLNAATHGEATHVRIRLVQVGSRALLLEVRDNGKGFDIDQIEPQRFGLIGIRDRARAFDGGCSIESAPGKGTRLTVRIPLASGDMARALY